MTEFHGYTEQEYLDAFIDADDHQAVRVGADRLIAGLRQQAEADQIAVATPIE